MTMQTSIIIYIVFALIGRIFSQMQRRKTQPHSFKWQSIGKDTSAIVSFISGIIAFGLPLVEAALKENALLPIKSAIFGTLILAIGWIIACSANREIGVNWSPIIEKNEKQNLITSGIYGYVRHPFYLSGLCILIGTNLYFSNTWAWIGTLLALIIILIRIPIEEKKLKERFGDEYTIYMSRTKAMIPWII